MKPLKKISKNLLKADEHFDVTIVLEDGEIKSSKFVLCATSDYFSKMFKCNSFRESVSGIVEMPCKKNVMEKIIRHLYGVEFEAYRLSVEEKIEALSMSKMMMIDDVYIAIENDLMQLHHQIHDAASLEKCAETYEALLKCHPRVGKWLGHYMASKIDVILMILNESDVLLSSSLILDITSSPIGKEMDKFKVISHFKNTVFAENKVPEIELDKLTIDELEKIVKPSEIFDVKTVTEVINRKLRIKIKELERKVEALVKKTEKCDSMCDHCCDDDDY